MAELELSFDYDNDNDNEAQTAVAETMIKAEKPYKHFPGRTHMSGKIREKTPEPAIGVFAYDSLDYKNEEHLLWLKHAAVDSSITGIIFICPKGRLSYANDAALKIWGWDDGIGFLGNYAAAFCQSLDRIVDIFNIVHREGSWCGEIGTVRKDGSLNTVHLQASLIRNWTGDPICIMCSFVDITEKKNLEAQMRISECALASSINGMAITDGDGNITYVNDAFYRMWGGIFPEEVIGRPIMAFADSRKLAGDINREIFGNGRWFGELKGKRRDGSTFDVQLSISTATDSNMDATHVLYAFVDITDRKNAERELKKSHEQLEMRVLERTRELRKLNRENTREIEERKETEKRLLQKEKDLIEKSRELEDMNATLKVLLRLREKDQENLGTDIFSNVEKIILPYIRNLLNSPKLCPEEREYVLIMESHIREIVSPFLRKLQTACQKLTPTEILVANLVRDAKSTREIASVLNTSIRAIQFHRKNIRRKLNITNKKLNLRSYLLTLH